MQKIQNKSKFQDISEQLLKFQKVQNNEQACINVPQ